MIPASSWQLLASDALEPRLAAMTGALVVSAKRGCISPYRHIVERAGRAGRAEPGGADSLPMVDRVAKLVAALKLAREAYLPVLLPARSCRQAGLPSLLTKKCIT